MGKITTYCYRRPGVAVVEAAVVLPLIVWLALAIFEYGYMFHKSYQVGNAARVAARQAAMPTGKTNEVKDRVNELLKAAKLTGIVCTLTPPVVQDVTPPDAITAYVQVDYVPLTNAPVISLILPVPKTLHASVTMNKEGF